MTITHAMEGARGQRKVKVVRHDDDSYTVEMTTEMPDKSAIIQGCKLSREALVLLSLSLLEFIQNIDQFEIELKDGEESK